MAFDEMHESRSRVEVSGWDMAEEFFVEKGFLSVGGDGVQRIMLQTGLRLGSFVFLRCIDGASAFRSVPVTYQVVSISENWARAGREFSLRPVRPRQGQTAEFSGCIFSEAMPN